jgi:hypothetical protein
MTDTQTTEATTTDVAPTPTPEATQAVVTVAPTTSVGRYAGDAAALATAIKTTMRAQGVKFMKPQHLELMVALEDRRVAEFAQEHAVPADKIHLITRKNYVDSTIWRAENGKAHANEVDAFWYSLEVFEAARNDAEHPLHAYCQSNVKISAARAAELAVQRYRDAIEAATATLAAAVANTKETSTTKGIREAVLEALDTLSYNTLSNG